MTPQPYHTVRDHMRRALGLLAMGHHEDAREALLFALDVLETYTRPDAGAAGAVGESPDEHAPAKGRDSSHTQAGQ
jgi:GH15 family glucan-1,4-alpha-glucosidase